MAVGITFLRELPRSGTGIVAMTPITPTIDPTIDLRSDAEAG
ncbi:MAG TPA: hypothetical protein VFE27_20045 [Acidobacteriaceae bacterium]|nr:hypothetical protein [Acidobacteriaceae bacterium]